jgi:hypothetical protein
MRKQQNYGVYAYVYPHLLIESTHKHARAQQLSTTSPHKRHAAFMWGRSMHFTLMHYGHYWPVHAIA